MIVFVPFIIIPQKKQKVKVSELESYFATAAKTIKTNYSMVSIMLAGLLFILATFIEPSLIRVLYILRDIPAPTWPYLLFFVAFLFNLFLLFSTLMTTNPLNNEVVQTLKRSTEETVEIPGFKLVNNYLNKLYGINGLFTVATIFICIFGPILLHPQFPNL